MNTVKLMKKLEKRFKKAKHPFQKQLLERDLGLIYMQKSYEDQLTHESE